MDKEPCRGYLCDHPCLVFFPFFHSSIRTSCYSVDVFWSYTINLPVSQ